MSMSRLHIHGAEEVGIEKQRLANIFGELLQSPTHVRTHARSLGLSGL